MRNAAPVTVSLRGYQSNAWHIKVHNARPAPNGVLPLHLHTATKLLHCGNQSYEEKKVPQQPVGTTLTILGVPKGVKYLRAGSHKTASLNNGHR